MILFNADAMDPWATRFFFHVENDTHKYVSYGESEQYIISFLHISSPLPDARPCPSYVQHSHLSESNTPLSLPGLSTSFILLLLLRHPTLFFRRTLANLWIGGTCV